MVDSDAKNLSETSSAKSGATSLSTAGCVLVLTTAFLGWMFSGVHMGINALAMRNAADDLLERHFLDHGVSSAAVQSTIVDASIRDRYDANQDGSLDQRELAKAREGMIGQWFGWLIAAFLFGAAAGGYLFGWVGDRFGRAKAMAFSILCYSLFSAATVWVQEPWQLWLLRFLTCLGIGGMWPNGIALVSEAWPNISRPMLAGAIGTAANVGIMIFALITVFAFVTTENWRWVMWFGATPVVLGFLVLLIVPESPRWLELKLTGPDTAKPPARISDVFRPPILKTTLIGISLGTVPLFGGWGSAGAEQWGISNHSPNKKRRPSLYAYYLWHPWAMDDDLETGFYIAGGGAAAAGGVAGGLVIAGVGSVTVGTAASVGGLVTAELVDTAVEAGISAATGYDVFFQSAC